MTVYIVSDLEKPFVFRVSQSFDPCSEVEVFALYFLDVALALLSAIVADRTLCKDNLGYNLYD